MKVLTILPILFLLLLLSCTAEDSQNSLGTLFDEEWAFRMQENPLFATNAGHHNYNDRLTSCRSWTARACAPESYETAP